MMSLAVELAEEAGRLACEHAGRTTATVKPDGSLLTGADGLIQGRILAAIANNYPSHAVCAEETVAHPGAHACPAQARYTWVIDPLDGTRNYISGFPCVATSIAVLDRGAPVIGVVREHNLGRLYTAVAHGGAKRNGEPFRIPAAERFGDVLVGFASSKDRLTVGVVKLWAESPGVILRNTGSTAAHLCFVAEGALAAAFGKRVMLWDIAAGALIVREAGGQITSPQGKELLPFDLTGDIRREFPYLAAASSLHNRAVAMIRQVMAEL